MMKYGFFLAFASSIIALALVLNSIYKLYRAEQMFLDALARDRKLLFSATQSLEFLSVEGLKDERDRQELFHPASEFINKINKANADLVSLVIQVGEKWPRAYLGALFAALEQSSDNSKASYLLKLNRAIKERSSQKREGPIAPARA